MWFSKRLELGVPVTIRSGELEGYGLVLDIDDDSITPAADRLLLRISPDLSQIGHPDERRKYLWPEEVDAFVGRLGFRW